MDDRERWREWMLAALERMTPWPRLINTEGIDRAAEIVVELLPGTQVHEYPSGREYGSWVVPPRWRCRNVQYRLPR